MHCVLIEINITALVLLHHHIFLYIVQKNQQLQMDMRDVLHHAHCVVDKWTVSVINWPSTAASIVSLVQPMTVQFIT